MQRLINLAKKIKNKELREKVTDFLKDSQLSNKYFKKYTREKLERAGSVFGVGRSSMGPVERDIINHTVALTEIVIKTSDLFKKHYGIDLDLDSMIAASILHDVMKAYEFKRDEDDDLVPTGLMLDHTLLGVAELYVRDFPEDVIHIVASHPGDAGTTTPRSFEAVIFHHLDSMCSVVEYFVKSKKKMEERIMLMTQKQLEEMGEKPE